MLSASWRPYRLNFSFTAVTSRQAMNYKDTYIVEVSDSALPGWHRTGECALFKGLSADDCPDFESQLTEACKDPEGALNHPYSAIRFGFEQALSEREPTGWSRGETGIPINGLIWMGDKAAMAKRIAEKLDAGFRVLKLKIGGICFDDEVDLLRNIRRQFSASVLELRLDANGSFASTNALERLNILSAFDIHSLEQPIRAGHTEDMARICAQSPIPIALDEELIGTRNVAESEALVRAIRPAYLILKPALCGGFRGADQYIGIASRLGLGWWATSALESNVGLEAIAHWLSEKGVSIPQGLGTGMLYTNNFPSPLELRGSELWRNVQ